MPTYDYLCGKCGKFEAVQSISSEPYKVCPHCGSNEIRRLISGNAGVVFKGSGFYCTDHRKASGDSGSSAAK